MTPTPTSLRGPMAWAGDDHSVVDAAIGLIEAMGAVTIVHKNCRRRWLTSSP